MRTVKEAAVRRNEILDAAQKLFVQKGFEAASINDILKEVGIARGTLYYHFKSKEEILDAMIARLTDSLLAEAGKIASRQDIPLIRRMTMTMASMNVDNELGSELLTQVHKPENALLHHKMQERLHKGIVPIVTRLLEEGIAQDLCHTDYPAQTADMIMVYSMEAFDDLAADKQDPQKIAGFIYNTERLLGMPENSLGAALLPLLGN